jgi:hypothetical protein
MRRPRGVSTGALFTAETIARYGYAGELAALIELEHQALLGKALPRLRRIFPLSPRTGS